MSDVTPDFDEMREAVEDGDHDALRDAVESFLAENYDAAQFSTTMEAIHVEFPHPEGGEPRLEAAFFEHEGVPSRNTTATVRLAGEREQVEVMASEALWEEMKARWARDEPFNEAVERGIRNRLGLDEE